MLKFAYLEYDPRLLLRASEVEAVQLLETMHEFFQYQVDGSAGIRV